MNKEADESNENLKMFIAKWIETYRLLGFSEQEITDIFCYQAANSFNNKIKGWENKIEVSTPIR